MEATPKPLDLRAEPNSREKHDHKPKILVDEENH
jgi:hypothetical protein